MLPLFSVGQLEVKETAKSYTIGSFSKVGKWGASLVLYTMKNDSAYAIEFRNEEFTTLFDYKAVIFRDKKGSLKGLYDVLKSFYIEENKNNKDYNVNIKLGKEDVYLVRYKSDIWFRVGSSYFTIREKDIDKLFGKV